MTVADIVACAAYLALVGVLALGLGAALRSAVLTLTVLLAMLKIVPLSLQEPDITVLNRIADVFPGVAGGTSWPATPSRTRRRSGCCCSPGGPAPRCWPAAALPRRDA